MDGSAEAPSLQPAPRVLFTIGHSTHPTDEFLRLLGQHEITALCDVRSAPYSRYNPQFNKESLAAVLNEAGIAYVYLGRELGAMVRDPACWEDRRVSYPKVARTEFFRVGLDRVRDGMRSYRVTLMCAEKDPITCHRMMLVTRNLRDDDFDIRHIRADGTLEMNAEAERRLLELSGLPPGTLFQDEAQMVEEAYELVGKKMAWKPDGSSDLP